MCFASAWGAESQRSKTVQYKLKNGDVVSGVLVEEDKQSIVLQSLIFGEITIPRNSVILAETGTATPPKNPAVEKVAAPAPTKSAPQGVAPADKPWRTKVEFGFYSEKSVKDTTRQNVLLQSEKTAGAHNLRATGKLSYARQNKRTTNDRIEANFRWRHNLPGQTFTQTKTSYFRDQIALIDTNIEQNVGLGYRLMDSDRITLNVGAGLTGQYREADNLESNIGALTEFFQDQSLQLNDTTKIVQSVSLQYWPSAPLSSAADKSEENLKWRFSTALVTKLSESISVNIRYEYDFDNAVANPAARETQRVTSSLGYLF